MKIREIINHLELIAPLHLQEDYDNSGLITGNEDQILTNTLVSLDCTDAVIDEAIQNNCNLVISHHPIIFRGLKKLTGKNYVERTIIKAIQHNIAIYAIHTNLDNVLKNGVNSKIASKIGLCNTKILSPLKHKLAKLTTYVPIENASVVRSALFEAGAGRIGEYEQCSFNTEGIGTFKGGLNTNPFVGKPGELHFESEVKIETIFPRFLKNRIIDSLLQSHPYEEVAYDIHLLENEWIETGAGIIGDLESELETPKFLGFIKDHLGLTVIRHTSFDRKIKRVAICGGSGSFLLSNAINNGADAYITSDFKYHEFFDAEGRLMICDVGHFESEQYTPELIIEIIRNKFPNFAPVLAKTKTNPINYYY